MGAHRNHAAPAGAAVLLAVAAAATCVTPALAAEPDVNWTPIIHCESGGNPTIHNATSTASGLFQFLDSTWQHYGGTDFAPTAAQATPAQQYIVANRAYAANGLNDWGPSRGCWGDELATILGSTAPAPRPVVVAPKPAPKAPPAVSVASDAMLLPAVKPAPAPVVKPAPTAAAPAAGAVHTVKPGDTLWGIAPAHAWHALYQRNRNVVGNNPNLIYPGQQLRL